MWRSGFGGTWEQRARDPNSPILAIAADPKNPDVVYAASPQGVVKSTDGGRIRRRALRGAHVLALAIDPIAPRTIYASIDGRRLYAGTVGYGVAVVTLRR